ncbi:MAG: allantoinase AllB [Thermoanaerobaculia bacterium]
MTALRSKRVVANGHVSPATIHIENGVVERLGPYDDLPRPEARGPRPELVDYGDRVIMPGLVDSHVHVNEPGRTEWEGFITATRAAAAGGITTIVDMPLNSIPATTTVGALKIKAEAMQGKLRVDVGLWGGVIPGNIGELRPMLQAGALGFKCFLVHSGVDEFPDVDEQQLRAAAHELALTGAPLLVHAELPGPIEAAEARGRSMDAGEYSTYLASRPPAAEDQAVELLFRVCEATGARIHIVHLSSANALETLRRARERRLPLTAETTPHYLHLEAEQVPRTRCEFKCAPPIREHANRERLWSGLEAELIDLVVSDHSPCTPHLKGEDFLKAWGGIASLQFVLPIVWTEAQRRGRPLTHLARWLCEGPARLAGLRSKGSIAPGNDADFVIWSPEESFVVEPSIIEHRHKVTPYLGERFSGVVHATWLRGRRIFENREHFGEPRGGWLRRHAQE